MVIISDNFSNSKKLLRSEYKRRIEDYFQIDEQLENETWILFYKLGFKKLNIERECEVSYGKNNHELTSKKVDIIAESEDTRVYIECTTQQPETAKIKQWVSETEDIRKFERSNPETRDKNVLFVYCNNKSINKLDRERLEKKGIIYLNITIIEYFLKLNSTYSKLAYYQFISFLCKGKLIRSLSESELTVPAIRCKYGSKNYCYIFGIQPSRIIPLATVPHRKLDFDDQLNHNYQRLINKTKINSIKKFITNQRGVFPTNIIVSIEHDKEVFKPSGKAINEIQHGTITLPRKYQSIYIIDGQHRLFAYDGLESSTKDLIYVVAFLKMNLEEQIKTFIDINEKQTKVSSSLLWDLFPTILEPDDIRYRIAVNVKKLNEGSDSSLYGLITYDSAPSSLKRPQLTLESVCTAIKTEKIFDDINSSMELLRISNSNDKISYTLISLFFQSIKEHSLPQWDEPDKTKNLLRSNQGFGALMKIFSQLIPEFLKNDVFDNLRNKDFDKIKQEFINYLKPILVEVDKIETIEEAKKWKRLGEGGKQQLFIDFIKLVRKDKPNFCDKIIKNEEDQELNEIIKRLNQDSEHIDLEVKESFFVDTRKLKNTGELSTKEDMTKKIIKTIVAFANYFGGQIIVGLEDNSWNIVGLDDTDLKFRTDWDKLKQSVANKIRNLTEGLIPLPKIRRILHKEKTVMIIDVEPLSDASIKGASLASMEGDCYKRENGDTIKIKGANIGKYCNEVIEQREHRNMNEEE